MIFYFSGTGNSSGVAKIIAEHIGDETCDIVGVDPLDFSFTNEDYLGIVFPVYAWAAPEIVLEFVQKLSPCSAFTFAIATYSNVAGLALEQLSASLPLKSGYGLKMPDNFPVFPYIVETKESAIEKLAAAEIKLAAIIATLKEKKAEPFIIDIGEDAENRTYNLSQKFNECQRKTESYWVENNLCTGCGLCEKICPAKAIVMQDKRPIWLKTDCFLCMACLNRCPTQAIEFGEHSQNQYRYVFKGFDKANY